MLTSIIVCPSLCATCTSASVCQSCNTGYGLYDNLCQTCPSSTFLSSGNCASISFHITTFHTDIDLECLKMEIDYIKAFDIGHQYQFSLYPDTCNLAESIVQENLAVTPTTKANLPAFLLKVTKTGHGNYTVNLILKDNVLQRTPLDLVLYSLSATSYVPRTFIPSDLLLKIAGYTEETQLAITAYLAVTFPGTMLLHLTSALWNIVSFQQFVSYFIFINIAYPFQVNLFFSFTKPQIWSFIPNPLDSLMKKISQKFPKFINDDLEDKNRPQKFIDEDRSSSFVSNGGSIIALNIEILLLLVVLLLLRKISFFLHNRPTRIVYENLRWNVIIRIFLENGTPLMFAIFLQSRVLSLDSIYHYVVLFFVLFSTLYFITMMIFSTTTLVQRSIDRLKEEGVEKIYGTLYEGINLTDAAAKYYYLIILMRGVVITFVVTFVDSLLLLQIVILIFYNVFFVWYMFKCVVFKSRSLTIISRTNQLLILGAEIFILCLYFDTTSSLYYNIIGWLICGSLFIALMLELGYLGVVQIMKIKGIWRRAKQLWERLRRLVSKKEREKENMKRRRLRRRTEGTQSTNVNSTVPIHIENR